MKLNKPLIIYIFLAYIFSTNSTYVTFGLMGRLGDSLISFSRALFISTKYDIPIKINQFDYCDKLVLGNLPKINALDQFLEFNHLNDNLEKLIDHCKNKNKNLLLPYYPESIIEIGNENQFKTGNFTVEWENKKFKKRLLENIKLKKNIQLINPPAKCISIAIHVRKYSGSDFPLLEEAMDKGEEIKPLNTYGDVVFPWKCVPEKFYLDCLKSLFDTILYNRNNNIYIFIFTDYPNPNELVEKFKTEINKNYNKRIIWSCRNQKNVDTDYVLNDLFSFRNFDYFIRTDSNLAIIGEKIGSNVGVISPNGHYWKNNRLTISDVKVKHKDHVIQNLIRNKYLSLIN